MMVCYLWGLGLGVLIVACHVYTSTCPVFGTECNIPVSSRIANTLFVCLSVAPVCARGLGLLLLLLLIMVVEELVHVSLVLSLTVVFVHSRSITLSFPHTRLLAMKRCCFMRVVGAFLSFQSRFGVCPFTVPNL